MWSSSVTDFNKAMSYKSSTASMQDTILQKLKFEKNSEVNYTFFFYLRFFESLNEINLEKTFDPL